MKQQWNMAIFIAFMIFSLTGCTSVPNKGDAYPSFFVKQPLEKTKKYATDALLFYGFNITKDEPKYIEGYRPHIDGSFWGSGRETVGIWFESESADYTSVDISADKSLEDTAKDKDWGSDIRDKMMSLSGQ